MKYIIVVFISVFGSYLAFCNHASAQTITQLELLDFGRAIVADNDDRYVLRVRPNNNLGRVDAAYTIITPPTRGLYLLSGAPPNTAITSVTVTLDGQMSGPGVDFRLGGFQTRHDPTTDASGEASWLSLAGEFGQRVMVRLTHRMQLSMVH